MAVFLHIYSTKMCQIIEMCHNCLPLDPKCTKIPLLRLINHGFKFINHHGWKVSQCHESKLEFFTAANIFLMTPKVTSCNSKRNIYSAATKEYAQNFISQFSQ